MGHHGHRGHGQEHERDGEHGERADLGAQLARRRRPARGVQQRREEDEEDDLRLELEGRQPRDQPDPEPEDDEHDRVRDARAVGQAHAERRRGQHQHHELDVAQGRHSRIRPPVAARLTPPLGPEDHVAGPAGAPLELVMYGDFQCPYCSAAQPIVRRVRERLGDRLRFAFRHLPLPALHPDAQRAAEASESAAAQGAFWPMHDALYAQRGRLGLEDVLRAADQAGVDPERVRADLEGGDARRSGGARRGERARR